MERKKPWSPWSSAEHEQLAALSRQGMAPVEIAALLGRSVAVVNKKRLDLGLVNRSQTCLECGQVMVQCDVGRPKRYCSIECVAAKASRRRAAARQKLIEERTDWTCLVCGGELERDRPSRKYCSNTCNKRAWYVRKRASKPSP